MTRALLSVLLWLPLQAQAASADELLRQVRESSAAATQANAAREARFLKNRNEQVEMLRQAESELAAVKARADRVKAQFDVRQKEITDIQQRLNARAGDFTQLFAVARQGAADLRAAVAPSPVSAQFPARLAFLDRVANSPAVPGIPELETLWVTLQEELTENGKVARFEAEVLSAGGGRQKAAVIRVGSFSAFTGEEYLYGTGDGSLRAVLRAPLRGAGGLAEDFAEQASGWAPILIDPSGGSLLSLHAERPTMGERVEQGGFVGYFIIAMGGFGLLAATYQFFYLWIVGGRMRAQLRAPAQPDSGNPLGRVLGSLGNAKTGEDPEVLEVKLSEAVLKETPRLERFQAMLRMFVAAGPLLGLVGTVTGMIITFQVITEVGSGDPKLMAGGISQAMVTAVLGLGVAIPLLFINSLLMSQSRILVQMLDEQAAGLLARQLEKLRA